MKTKEICKNGCLKLIPDINSEPQCKYYYILYIVMTSYYVMVKYYI